MILKFDHISYSCDMKYDYRQNIPESYIVNFVEKRLKNISCKQQFLQFHADTHNIIMLNDKNEGVPIEITQYPKIFGRSRQITVNGQLIIYKVKNIEETKRFFECLGVKELHRESQKIQMGIKPFLDGGKEYIFQIEENNEKELTALLDLQGFSSVAFVVDNVISELKRVNRAGFCVTSVSSIVVNKNLLNIGFAVGNNKEIVELISFR